VLGLAIGCALCVVVIWIGYPLVIAALAARGDRNHGSSSVSVKRHVSVIIATRDEPSVIRARVADVLASDYPRELLEIVVGTDRGGAQRPEQVADQLRAEGANIHVVAGDAPGGKAATLNAAVSRSTGELLVFTDAAQRFAPQAIALLVDSLEDVRFGAVSGALHIGGEGRGGLADTYWRFEKWLRLNESRVHSTVGVTGAVYAMRRSCWRPLPAGLILDDVYGPMDLVLRGHRVGFRPDARAYDDRRFPAAQEFRRKARTLTGVLQLCAWLPRILIPWRNPIWTQFVFHKLLRLTTPYFVLVGMVAGIAWLASVLASATPAIVVGTLTIVALAILVVLANRRLREGVSMMVAMQAAVLRATVNGLRGEWDVWSR
jgi:cellulose synthase/poly-beta-1,6-N-acetylglucosamine synthase-like glycosyltransferase